MRLKRKAGFLALMLLFFLNTWLTAWPSWAKEEICPGVNDPAPTSLRADLPRLIFLLSEMKDLDGRKIWKKTAESEEELYKIFETVPPKTKLEEFFQLMNFLQRHVAPENLPVVVTPPGITEVLLAAHVFKTPDFPKKITSVEFKKNDPKRSPVFRVQYSDQEVRFPINEGKGFASWDQGMCQIAKELVFYPGFSFRVRKARNSKNLVVEDFDKVQIYGQFGTRKIVDIDLQYVDLEKVEFITETDQGKVTARVSKREFAENAHSFLFKFIGTLIPNTSQQRIDW